MTLHLALFPLPSAHTAAAVDERRPARRTARPWPLWLLGVLLMLLAAHARAEDDPPGRVGRIAQASGTVAFQPIGQRERIELSRESLQNWPVSGGDRLTTGAGGRVELEIGSTVVRLGEHTRLELLRLDDEGIMLQLQQGSLAVWIRREDVAREISIKTPGSSIQPLGAALLRVDVAGRDARVKTDSVTAWRASVSVEQDGASLRLNPGQRAERLPQGDGWRLGAPLSDAFASWAMRTDEPATPSPGLDEMTGADTLARYGDWYESDEYGQVWSPRGVDRDWAPYRQGRWVWVTPWGWTWVDQAPWGFAPFHYGRWVTLQGRWSWVPGRYQYRPVYAPALVVWSGRPGASFSFTIGPGVSWFPLAPREVYVPYYPCGPRHIGYVNQPHGVVMPPPRQLIDHPDDYLRDTRYRYGRTPGAISQAPSVRVPPVWQAPVQMLPAPRPAPRPEPRFEPPGPGQDPRNNWRDPRQTLPEPPPSSWRRPVPEPQPAAPPQAAPAVPASPGNQGAPGGRWSTPAPSTTAPQPPTGRTEPGGWSADAPRHPPERRHHDDGMAAPAPQAAPQQMLPPPVRMAPAPVMPAPPPRVEPPPRMEPPRVEAPRAEPPRQRFEPPAAAAPAPQANPAAPPANQDGRPPRFRRNAE